MGISVYITAQVNRECCNDNEWRKDDNKMIPMCRHARTIDKMTPILLFYIILTTPESFLLTCFSSVGDSHFSPDLHTACEVGCCACEASGALSGLASGGAPESSMSQCCNKASTVSPLMS